MDGRFLPPHPVLRTTLSLGEREMGSAWDCAPICLIRGQETSTESAVDPSPVQGKRRIAVAENSVFLVIRSGHNGAMKTPCYRVVWVLLAALVSNLWGGEFLVRDGDRVVLLGDSITEQRLYTTCLEAYALTR